MAIRIGIVGLGQIARKRHLPAIEANAGFALAGLADLGGGEAILDLPIHTDHQAMFAACPLDAVAICTPPAARFTIARDALLAGKHVLLEKPPAATMGEAEALVELAARSDRILYASWHSQCNRAVEAARLFLADKRLARLRVDWHEDFRRYHPDQEWIWQVDGLGVFDMAINALSVINRLFTAPPFVQSAELHIAANHAAPLAAMIRFGTLDGAGPLELHANWGHVGPDQRELHITTRCGHEVALLDSGGTLVIDGKVTLQEAREEYAMLYARFAELVQSGQSEADLTPLQMTLDALALGKRVALPRFEA
ncbi:MAG: Gfo/Idh/MocA family protein [Roseomonas sp.]